MDGWRERGRERGRVERQREWGEGGRERERVKKEGRRDKRVTVSKKSSEREGRGREKITNIIVKPVKLNIF